MSRPFASPSVDTLLVVVALILAVLAIAGAVSGTLALGIAVILLCIAILT